MLLLKSLLSGVVSAAVVVISVVAFIPTKHILISYHFQFFIVDTVLLLKALLSGVVSAAAVVISVVALVSKNILHI